MTLINRELYIRPSSIGSCMYEGVVHMTPIIREFVHIQWVDGGSICDFHQ